MTDRKKRKEKKKAEGIIKKGRNKERNTGDTFWLISIDRTGVVAFVTIIIRMPKNLLMKLEKNHERREGGLLLNFLWCFYWNSVCVCACMLCVWFSLVYHSFSFSFFSFRYSLAFSFDLLLFLHLALLTSLRKSMQRTIPPFAMKTVPFAKSSPVTSLPYA